MSSIEQFISHKNALQNYLNQLINAIHEIENEFSIQIFQEDVEENFNLSQLDTKFIVAVVGVIKRGKSTLLNAILGDKLEVLSTSVTPETAKLSFLTYSEEPCAYIHKINNTDVDKIELCDLPKYTSAYSKSKLDFRRKNKGIKELVLNTKYAEIHYPNSYLKNGVVLVDTPGVDDTDKSRSNITEEFITKADAVILVIDVVEGGLKESELFFVKNRIINRKSSKGIICVCNKIHALLHHQISQLDDLLELTKSKLIEELNIDVPVFPIDAKSAYESKLSNDKVKYSESRFEDFILSLETMLVEQKGKILLKKKITDVLNQVMDPVKVFLSYRINSENKNIIELSNDLNTLRERLSSQKSGTDLLLKKYEREKTMLKTSFELEVRNTFREILDLNHIEVSALQNKIMFLVDSLNQNIRRKTQNHFNELIMEINAFEIELPEVKFLIEYPEIVETELYTERNNSNNSLTYAHAFGATGGAIIGNIIFPGVGFLVGGVLGLVFGAQVSSGNLSKTETVLDRQKLQFQINMILQSLINSFNNGVDVLFAEFSKSLAAWFKKNINELEEKRKHLELLKNKEEKIIASEKQNLIKHEGRVLIIERNIVQLRKIIEGI